MQLASLAIVAWVLMVAQLSESLPTSNHHILGRQKPLQTSRGTRRLVWWWGDNDEEAETPQDEVIEPTSASNAIHNNIGDISPKTTATTTEKPSRWRAWFSAAKDKIKSAASRVKEELVEAKDSYKEGMGTLGSAIVRGGNATKEGILSAGRAIKTGAKKLGSAVKSGYKKIRLKIAGSGEKFNIIANRLKEKLEQGDERAIALMKKLGISITFLGTKVQGSSVQNKSVSVTEVLKEEGLLSNKSAALHTVVEDPVPSEHAEEEFTDDNEIHEEYVTNEVFHSAEAYEEFHSAEESFNNNGETPAEKASSAPSTHIQGSASPDDISVSSFVISTEPNTHSTKSATTTTPLKVAINTTTSLTTAAATTTITSLTTAAATTTIPSTTTTLLTTRTPSTTPEPATTVPDTTVEVTPVVTTPTTRITLPPITTTESTQSEPLHGLRITTWMPSSAVPGGELGTVVPLPSTSSEGPYEPPPFPDVFNDIEVHDRLREFYDNGDFSHSALSDLFNFDPDNYEYYHYYDY